MKIQTVNQLISVFKDISTRHYQINGFGIGDEWEIGASKAEMHPVLWINPVTATMPSTDSGYKTFEIDFEVRVFDLVSKGETNENDVLSDCIDILKDIITEFKGHPYYVNSQLNIIDDISFEAFTEEFDEEVSGWVCEISLMTPILNSFCGIPAADITGFEFPGTDCPEVNVLCPVFVEDVTGVYPIVVTTVGTTKEVSIVGGGISDTFVISGVYDTGTLTLTRNDSVDVVVTGFASGGDNDYTTAATLSGNIITFDRTDTVGAYSVDLTNAINSAPDKFVSSGAYDAVNNKIVLTLNDASTVDIDTSAIGGGASIYTADGTIGAGRIATLTDTLKFTDGTVEIQGKGVVGNDVLSIYGIDSASVFKTYNTSTVTPSEQFSIKHNSGNIELENLRGDISLDCLGSFKVNNGLDVDGVVNVQGIGTVGSSALAIYDNDTTPNKLWDFLDNGNVNLGGSSVINQDSNILQFSNINSIGGLKFNGTSNNGIGLNLANGTDDFDFVVAGSSNTLIGTGSLGLLIGGKWRAQVNQSGQVSIGENFEPISGFDLSVKEGVRINGVVSAVSGLIGANPTARVGYDLVVDNKAEFGNEFSIKSPAGTMQFNGYRSQNTVPNTATFPNDKDLGIHKNTSTGVISLCYNDGGVIKSVQLT